ncbi:hypothetical protein GFB49_11620 [Epibacterium sp. SM1979]|uniref:Uncharacterized protein n=1 Tax=Tritonibacter litoralis TaxID=2662264 RepID=A0A843YHF8_9RHOB|nr:hypothetical protein [Tritonibacter litoralis]MQQ09105.1 hypothetical protein [Tritonibacter litoralis]
MELAYYAKAITAFVFSLIVPPVLLWLLGGDSNDLLGAAILGATSALITAFAVFLVPNRTHGFNVNDIAASLVQAGFDAVEQREEIEDDKPQVH